MMLALIRLLYIFVFFFVLLGAVYSVSIYGEIYNVEDFSLMNNCVLLVNSSPSIRVAITNGSYYIDMLKEGCYNILVRCYTQHILWGSDSANLCIEDINSSIRYDFVIFPEDNEVIMETIENTTFDDDGYVFNYIFDFKWYYLLLILLAPLMAYVLLKVLKKGKHNNVVYDDYMKSLIDILRKEKRINQKDLVRLMRLSDAKISLMITELERNGVIKKIKKGRANIIVYKGR